MGAPVRTYCVAGIATMAAGVVTFSPSIVPTQPDITVPAVELAGAQAPSPELIRWLACLRKPCETGASIRKFFGAFTPAGLRVCAAIGWMETRAWTIQTIPSAASAPASHPT